MARHPKTEVAAINLRIPSDRRRDYRGLIKQILEMKRGVRVFGDTYVALTFFDAEANLGAFSKYTEIDIDGDWFDLGDFDIATPDKIEEINIPENLKPNYAAFYFELDPDLHVICFEKYSDSKSLSTRSVEKYFKEILSEQAVIDQFGIVESDIVKSYVEVERILELPDLREIRLTIRRPNEDGISENLAKIIEERLREQHGEEYEEVIRSKDDGLTPNERTRQLAQVAAENGQIHAKSIVNGVLTDHDSSEAPLVEVTKYDPEKDSTYTIFKKLSRKLFGTIKAKRAAIGD